MDKPNLYPKMNANIVKILQTSDSPASHYAAALLEALQAQLESSRERERAAVRDMTHIADAIANCNEFLSGGTDRVSDLKLGRCVVCRGTCHDGNPCKFEWRGPVAGEGADK